MTKYKAILFLLSIILYTSCKVAEKDFLGIYALEKFPKTTLLIKSDNTFEFYKNNPNPYLHPFDHPSENYCITKGSWEKPTGNLLVLTSQSDSLVYPLFEIRSVPPRQENLSYFTFFDNFNDTVRLLYTELSNGELMGRSHGTSPFAFLDLRQRDTLEFHFYGYRPVKYISGEKKNRDYFITLKPEFQPNFFIGTKFRVKKNKILDVNRKGKFFKTKSGV